jgi:two-component system, chemotaxis family, sensor kinase CheA
VPPEMSAEDNAFRELLDEYVVECLPLAERAADALVELERQRRAGGVGDDLLGPLKGWLHTVKGNSAMMGLTPIQEAAHALEDLCAALADKPGEGGHPLMALLVEGGGLLVDQVRAAGGGGTVEGSARWLARAGEMLHAGGSGNGKAAERRRGERRGRWAEADGAPNVVRVDFRRLDTLLEVLGEGLIEQAAVAEAFRRIARHAGVTPGVPELDRAILALEKTMKRLEAVVMDTRLLPISSVFGRFPRLLRGVAEGIGKRVRLETVGGETALDKAVLDRLGEPLLHLLTNAVVHGVEAPADRRRAGKPEEAALRLAAASRSGRVAIEVADDGRGLDEARILARAEEMGIAAAGEGSDPQALIFQPGFSTADEVSGLAGRGVGLDVVAAAVRALGGTITVRSRPGQGTAFLLDIPLTLAIVRSLIVEVDHERYAVPIAQVAATVRTEPEALHEINHRGVALWRGGLIQVTDGGALLGTGGSSDRGRRFYVIISSGGRRRGILVDRLIGHQDVVVKGLDPALGRPDVVSGTTILGDGRVACILDPVRILERRVPA